MSTHNMFSWRNKKNINLIPTLFLAYGFFKMTRKKKNKIVKYPRNKDTLQSISSGVHDRII